MKEKIPDPKQVEQDPLKPETFDDLNATLKRILGDTVYRVEKGLAFRQREFKITNKQILSIVEFDPDKMQPQDADALIGIADMVDITADRRFSLFTNTKKIKRLAPDPDVIEGIKATLDYPDDQEAIVSHLGAMVEAGLETWQRRDATEKEIQGLIKFIQSFSR